MDNIRHFLGKLKQQRYGQGIKWYFLKLNRYFLMFYLMKQVELCQKQYFNIPKNTIKSF